MKKKVKAREQREARKTEKALEYTTCAASKENMADNSITVKTDMQPQLSVTSHKSTVKAAGLKSTIIDGDRLYITSFGKGNSAEIEQKINTDDYSVEDMRPSPELKVTDAGDINVVFSSSRPFVKVSSLTIANPLHKNNEEPCGNGVKDMLGLKSELEMQFFGKNFDDNIHIQIIYNILDIEKIIAVYSTNIAAALDHMLDGDNEDNLESDFIGYLGSNNSYEVFCSPDKCPALKSNDVNNINNMRSKFEKLLALNRLAYFGLNYDSKGKDKVKNEEIKKRLYHLMAFAGQIRQWSFHSVYGFVRSWLYQLESPNVKQEYRDTLDYYFDKRFDEINENFITQNATNLHIIKEIFPDEEFKSVADLYYDFIVVKSHKNMGFSIKNLREKMLECEGAERIKNQDMDTVRSKLYKLIDFCIFKYYHEHSEISGEIVDKLRSSVSDEQKEDIYADEAERIWSICGRQFLGFCKKINIWVKGEYQDEILHCIDKDTYRNRSNVSYFSKLMYAMCFFLDGKEINDLLTTLISKFDNIASFIDVARRLDMEVNFTNDYAFFNDCGRYVTELNIVRNISRMKKPAERAKKTMFRDALKILGIPAEMSEDTLEAELDKILEKKRDKRTGKPIKGKNPFRNFIANNVIENSRFIYVIKFCNPENVRKLVNNTKVTEFVLKRMPEEQIGRYYKSCIDSEKNPVLEKKIDALAEMMRDMDFGTFRQVEQRSRDAEKNKEKERFKAIIGLYLTVVYQLVKNLVYVNSRYVMAFHSVERDAQLYGVSIIKVKKQDDRRKICDYLALTDKLCSEAENSANLYLARNRRHRECIVQDLKNAKKWFVNDKSNGIYSYRNDIAHLSIVRKCDRYINDITKIDSYFALFHYLMQRELSRNLDPSRANFEKNFPQYAPLYKWHTYVKDMVKALNTPFGYNTPRFKNLSIDALFDRNEMKQDKDEKLDKQQ